MPVSQLPNLREVGDGVVGVNFIDGNLTANQNQLVLVLPGGAWADDDALSGNPGLQGPAPVGVQIREVIALPLLPDQVQNSAPHFIPGRHLPGFWVDLHVLEGAGELILFAVPLPVIVGDGVVGGPAKKAEVRVSVKVQVQNLHSFFRSPAGGVVVDVLGQTAAIIPLQGNGLSGKNRLQQALPIVDPHLPDAPVVLVGLPAKCLQHQRSPVRQRGLQGQEDMVLGLWEGWRLFCCIRC